MRRKGDAGEYLARHEEALSDSPKGYADARLGNSVFVQAAFLEFFFPQGFADPQAFLINLFCAGTECFHKMYGYGQCDFSLSRKDHARIHAVQLLSFAQGRGMHKQLNFWIDFTRGLQHLPGRDGIGGKNNCLCCIGVRMDKDFMLGGVTVQDGMIPVVAQFLYRIDIHFNDGDVNIVLCQNTADIPANGAVADNNDVLPVSGGQGGLVFSMQR